jgi:aminoglycoside/choline kinase family phosphotransferase
MIPNSPEAADVSWLNEVLRDNGVTNGRSIVGVRHEAVGQSAGFMSRLSRLHLTYDAPFDGAPVSLILKTPSASERTRDTVREIRMDEREVRFYRELAPVSGVRTPRCYCAELDEESGDFAVLMEDISHLRLGDLVSAASAEDAIAALRALARLHAAWWEDPRLVDMGWIRPSAAVIDRFLSRWDEAWPAFLERYRSLISPLQQEQFAALPDHVRRLSARLTAGPQTLLHGDFKLDNLAFENSGAELRVTMFDWGTLGRGPAMYDTADFMSRNLEPDVRSALFDDMLKAYHAELCSLGVEGYSFAHCLQDYRLQMLVLLLRRVVVGGRMEFANDTLASVMATTVRRVLAAATDADVFSLVNDSSEAAH